MIKSFNMHEGSLDCDQDLSHCHLAMFMLEVEEVVYTWYIQCITRYNSCIIHLNHCILQVPGLAKLFGDHIVTVPAILYRYTQVPD